MAKKTTKRSAAPARTAKQWARDISSQWHDAKTAARDAIFAIGQSLLDAKAALPHGEFEAMIRRDLPFEPGTARKYMALAQADWLKRAPVRDLPIDGWSGLYEISKLGEAGTLAAIEAGEITADTPRSKVSRILKRHKAEAAASSVPVAPPVAGCSVDDLHRLVAAGCRFPVFYADPAWPFETRSDLGKDKSPEMHYATMTIEDICAMPIGDLAADDCMLFMWIVPWLLPEAIEVLRAWGFEFKSVAFYWIKAEVGEAGALITDTGTGYYTRKSVEQCWIATRGNPSPLATDVRDFRLIRRGRHSEKPEAFAADIEKISAGPYLELFARRPRAGWSVWGNEVAPAGVFLGDEAI